MTTFTYDSVGNRLQKVIATGVTTSVYDAANELLNSEDASGITTYTYDNNGNQRSIETPANDITTSVWSYENQQSEQIQPTGDRTTFIYSFVNKEWMEYCVQKTTDTETIKYIWDNKNILQEYDSVTEAQFNYQPQPYGNLVSQYRDAESSFYHFDGDYSTSALTDSSEAETDNYKYSAFGKTINNTGTTKNPFTWKGKIGYLYDSETGLFTLRRRNYNENTGRFISEDPIGLKSGDSNFYRYGNNNPQNEIDPAGLGIPKQLYLQYSNADGQIVVNVVTPVSWWWDSELKLGILSGNKVCRQVGIGGSRAGYCVSMPQISALIDIDYGNKVRAWGEAEWDAFFKNKGTVVDPGDFLPKNVTNPGQLNTLCYEDATSERLLLAGEAFCYAGVMIVAVQPGPRCPGKGFKGGLGPSGKVSTRKFLNKWWDKATFGTKTKSIQYHVAKHGKGLSQVKYTQQAIKAFKNPAAQKVKTFDLQGRPALKVNAPEGRGLFTPNGRIIWFHPNI
ncbi:tRNA3(Ser)-specific nuclease WapA precursor [Gimesia maris]|uniref:RHS repeat domain-containing protein n=1 Tax=Gimesia maris TaxID=122 RepID=UPI001187A913|nr:RHS repeat-associated core domain-containing protein [Gimesia maris]QDU14108.1 tRNA3(Ser)-specific nuclease WapA precursor [Gimesia maris]